jgi:prepilin-type N-terminal cleavage/methylation domain-containing protein
MNRGFTLIELSIVLVIIGLVVGGVLVGQDLIRAAAMRATISQIEKYNTAVNTFYGKYGALPGDLNATVAGTFGFATRGQYAGEGDGNGLIEGISSNEPYSNSGLLSDSGERIMFWSDLTYANGQNLNLIEGSFSSANITSGDMEIGITGTNLDLYLPEAKMGNGNYLYVFSGGWQEEYNGNPISDGKNYFSLAQVSAMVEGEPLGRAGMTVAEAYSIDAKMDDGLPQTGRVTAYSGDCGWAGVGGKDCAAEEGAYDPGPPVGGPVTAGDGVTTAPSATTCYDNGGSPGATEQYSLSYNNGTSMNCALSFAFQ